MAGWPYTDLYNLNLDWMLKQLKTLSRPNPEVELPAISPSDGTWSIYRLVNGVKCGIKFDAVNGKMYFINGSEEKEVMFE